MAHLTHRVLTGWLDIMSDSTVNYRKRFPKWTFSGSTFYKKGQILKDISQKPILPKEHFPNNVFRMN